MCLPGGAGLAMQPYWAAGTASCYPVVTRTLAEYKTREDSVRKDKERAIVWPLSMQNIPFLGVVLDSFAPTQVKLIHNHLSFLNGHIDIPEV